MKKLVSLLLALIMVVSLVGCGGQDMNAALNGESETNEPATNNDTPADDQSADNQTPAEVDPASWVNADVEVYVTYNGEKFITFNESTPFTAPDGTTYKKGDLLPTWQYMNDKLNLNIVDKTPKSGSKEDLLLEQAAATQFEDANVFVGTPRMLSDYGVQGYFVPLNEHWDKLPNFKAFLDENPTVAASLTQADGNIYLTPYFDDIDQLERMFIMRIDWVQKLLDEDTDAYDTDRTIDTVYEPFYDYSNGKEIEMTDGSTQNFEIADNIIDIQNNLDTKNGATLVQSLKDYIDANYMNDKTGYTKRSELFTSSNAVYDADELIALMRAVKANPVYLTGENKDLTIYFPRRVKDDDKARMLATIWGVRGIDSRNGLYYLDSDDNVVDARDTDEFLTALDNLHKLYQEGLVLEDFDQAKGQTTDFRSINFQTNDGFLAYDYAASTVALHDLIPEDLQAQYGTVFEPVVSAAAPWFNDEFEHYAESNRSVKTKGGWGITTNTKDDQLDAALRLLDYPFTEDGLAVMSFGPKGLYWNDYTEIGGKQVPKLIDQFMVDRDTYANGNWSNFMRGFIGATFGIGHVKQTIALEQQVSNEHYKNGIDRILNSTTKLASLSTDVPPERRLMPTILPLNEDQIEASSINTYGQYYDEWQTRIIKYGFGTKIPNSSDSVPTKEQFKQDLVDKGIEIDQTIRNQAYHTIQ